MGKKYLIVGSSNFIGTGSDRIAVINGDANTINPHASAIALINCTGVTVGASAIVIINTSGGTYDYRYNNSVIVNGVRVNNNKSTTITNAASNNYIDFRFGMYYINDIAGNINIYLPDPTICADCELTFKRIAAGGNNIIFNGLLGTESLDGVALPRTLLPTLMDAMTITSNGTNWFIKSAYP